MKGTEIFALGAATGYVARGLIHAFEEIQKAKRDAKAKIEAARRRRDGG